MKLTANVLRYMRVTDLYYQYPPPSDTDRVDLAKLMMHSYDTAQSYIRRVLLPRDPNNMLVPVTECEPINIDIQAIANNPTHYVVDYTIDKDDELDSDEGVDEGDYGSDDDKIKDAKDTMLYYDPHGLQGTWVSEMIQCNNSCDTV